MSFSTSLRFQELNDKVTCLTRDHSNSIVCSSIKNNWPPSLCFKSCKKIRNIKSQSSWLGWDHESQTKKIFIFILVIKLNRVPAQLLSWLYMLLSIKGEGFFNNVNKLMFLKCLHIKSDLMTKILKKIPKIWNISIISNQKKKKFNHHFFWGGEGFG